jgi:hypothetical protein
MKIGSAKDFAQVYDVNGDKQVSAQEINDNQGPIALGDQLADLVPIERYRAFLLLDAAASKQFLEQANTPATRLYQRIAGLSAQQLSLYQDSLIGEFKQMDPAEQAMTLVGLRRNLSDPARQLLNQLAGELKPMPLREIETVADVKPLQAILAEFDTGELNPNFFTWISDLFTGENKAGDLKLDTREVSECFAQFEKELTKLTPEDKLGLFMHMSLAGQTYFLQNTEYDIGMMYRDIMSKKPQELNMGAGAVIEQFKLMAPAEQRMLEYHLEKTLGTKYLAFIRALQESARSMNVSAVPPVNQGVGIQAPAAGGVGLGGAGKP